MRLTSIPWLLVLAAAIRAEEPVDAWVQHLDRLPASTTALRLTINKLGLDGPVFQETDLAKLARFGRLRVLDLGPAGCRVSTDGKGVGRTGLVETRNPKHEIRNKSKARISKSKTP